MAVESGDIVRCDLHGSYEGVIHYMNVYHYKYTGATQLSNAQVVADMQAAMQAICEQSDDIQTNGVSFDFISCYNVTQDQPIGNGVTTGSQAGINSADGIPSGAAAVLSLATGLRRSIGKKFFTGVTESLITDGLFTSTALQTLEDIALYLVGSQTFNGHAYTPGVWSLVDLAFKAFTGYVLNAIPGYQRRRKQGVGI